jgi:hypothetical protein
VNKCYVIEDIGVQTHSYENGFYINDPRDPFQMIKEECEATLTHYTKEVNEWKAIHMHYSICFFCKELL